MPLPVADEMHCGSQSECVELSRVVYLVVVVGLVSHEYHGELGAAEDGCHVLIPVGKSGLHVNDEEHHVSLLGCHYHLLADGILEDVVALHDPSAGVYYRKLASVPLALAVLAVACCAGGVANDCLTCLGQAVEQCRLAHVRASHYCH